MYLKNLSHEARLALVAQAIQKLNEQGEFGRADGVYLDIDSERTLSLFEAFESDNVPKGYAPLYICVLDEAGYELDGGGICTNGLWYDNSTPMLDKPALETAQFVLDSITI